MPSECIAQSVARLCTFLPDGSSQKAEAPGYILNRSLPDRHLALCAAKAGARLLLRANVVERSEGVLVARMEGRELHIEAQVVIGSDGPHSLVARWMGLGWPRLARAMQYELPLRERLSAAEVYFRPAFRGGYAWLFPSGDTARVGAAFVDDGAEAVAGLRDLIGELKRQGKVIDSALSFTAGFVPLDNSGGTVQGNMLLVGDAAGQTHPITGAGIMNAVIAGEVAGQAAAQAVRAGDLSLLRDYEEEWQELMGPAEQRALEGRCRLESRWDSPPDDLSRTIRECWVTFDEYHRRWRIRRYSKRRAESRLRTHQPGRSHGPPIPIGKILPGR